ncbi:uncharacterized protein LOC141631144 [Silene latifolia]|uniref:uncharacterized protein LOC141631144 n=1 Tax=Silene latifolia TaxID=37657 RepID=UPI003D772008
MGLAWNYRGLSNALSPIIPKIRALLSKKYYDFVFIMETKCNVECVSPLFRSFGFEKSVGVDVVGASEGLWIYDHAPIELDLNLVRNVSRKPYKLNSWALENEECLLEIRKAWKLALVRQKVKSWTLDKRNEWNQKWEDFDIRLKKGMELAIREGKDEEHSKVDEEVRAFARAAASFLKQRAKIRWAVDGDACTKYFFNWVKGPNLDFLDAADDIFTGITKHITNDEADWLRKPFSAKKVRKAVFQIEPLKSPGPDGIPAFFFQKCCWWIKSDFTRVVLSLLNSGRVLREVNFTFITLIPKGDNPETVQDYPPISLCNVFMRIVTKCIANRMSKVMGSLVGEFQNAFIPGRLISDNILLADMSNAYDMVRRQFLELTLTKFGFP